MFYTIFTECILGIILVGGYFLIRFIINELYSDILDDDSWLRGIIMGLFNIKK